MGIKESFFLLMKLIWNKVTFKKPKPEAFFTKDHFKNKSYIIGDYTYGKPTVLFDNNDANLIIGKFCTIAGNTTIFLGGNHRTDWITTYPFNILFNNHPIASKIVGHPKTNGDVVIGNDVWIGYGATIMSGIKIGNGAVIAAHSVVTKNIGDYEIWGGNPAKFLKKRFSESEINCLLKLKWWDWKVEKILENSNVLCNSSNTEIQLLL